ncbi:O-antigen/teichoic acid export membrane protein [Ulvibacter sp. MAR_2010_11]|uniref:lipopolysaccharide biosynthesis protein n=1 Tax=Ulvibacter sp. MAR_2010_11 TaxID=1250229 RepID=UPI000C2BF54F|nr:oligosaccharide flippase family protein [Ulvibacter sp. MAR_2010_11]PKA82888.1 O-antigen/teichoic acid export membrane protein [Ulvibacter sp. MAR_2010_11]
MSVFKKLFKQTFIYGLATVLPRALAIFLVPLYVTVLGKEQYGIYASLMAFLILGNVVLSYGMETAFFRFINKDKSKKAIVQSTALTSLTISTLLFLGLCLLVREPMATFLEFKTEYVTYGLLILALDALVVLPFVWFRANERPMRYAIVKIFNVLVNLGFNLFFFLVLPGLATGSPDSFWSTIYSEENNVAYVFIANLIASGITLLILSPLYVKIGFKFNTDVWKQMLKYALPVLIAGIAFSINEAFDKILLKYLLPSDIAEAEVGIYAACYKLGVFMTLFATAFRLGIEPFFFNHAHNENAKQTYATITKYFTVFGCVILLFVIVYIDVFKRILIPESDFWEALVIVPIILLANLCLGIYHNLSVWYKVTDRTKFGAYISVVGAIITLALNFALIPIISYKGSAIATLAAYGTMMVLSYFIGQKHYPVPYNLKKIGGFLVVSISFSALSFYVFEGNLMIGTTLLLVFLLLIYVAERKEFYRILRK